MFLCQGSVISSVWQIKMEAGCAILKIPCPVELSTYKMHVDFFYFRVNLQMRKQTERSK